MSDFLSAADPSWQPIIHDLYCLIHDNNWAANFADAIFTAKSANVPDLDQINTVHDCLDSFNSFVFWVPSENHGGAVVYNKLCLFYWILDQPSLSRLQIEEPHSAAVNKLTALSKWIVRYANTLGAFYDTPESLTEHSLASFYKSPAYKMDQYQAPPRGWKTFNEFFARHVKPGAREPVEPDNPEVIVSAADSVFDGHMPIDGKDNVIFVKGVPWSISELLQDCKHAEAFTGGTFMHAFLNTTDYHRQFLQARGCVVIDSPVGLVAILPIGMAQVSSVRLSVKKGDYVEKGQEISYFQFGGSDIVMVFEAKSKVKFTATTTSLTHYNVGEQIATAEVLKLEAGR